MNSDLALQAKARAYARKRVLEKEKKAKDPVGYAARNAEKKRIGAAKRKAADPVAYLERHRNTNRKSRARVKEADPELYAQKVSISNAKYAARLVAEGGEHYLEARRAYNLAIYYRLKDSRTEEYKDKIRGGRQKRKWGDGKARDNSAQGVYDNIMSFVPRTLPEDVRQDVAAAMMLEILEGKLLEGAVKKRVQGYIRSHFRMFDGFKTSSLDEVIPGTDNLRRIDTIASDDPHF